MNLTCLKSGIWQVELRIPADVRVVLGRTRFAQSTGTRDKRKASNKALPILTEWQQLITTARQSPELIQPKPDRTVCLSDAAQGHDGRGDSSVWLDELKPSQAKLYDAIEWGEGVSLPTHMSEFIEVHYTRHRTQLEARRYILEATLFIHTLGDLNRGNAQRWISTEELKPLNERRAVKTMQKAVGFLSEYIEWLRYKGFVSQNLQNPFKDLHFSKQLARPRQYLPLSFDELCLLRQAAKDADDAVMVTYIDIGRFTGMRLSEIGELSKESIVVESGVRCFRVRPDAKTEASSNRLIPIASSLTTCVDLESLDLRGTGNAVGKRFGRLKRRVLKDGSTRQKCFHSLRKSVVTELERAGIAEGVAADLVGHEKPNITYNVYSGGSSIEQLSHAVKVLERSQQDI
jgi:integrase